MSLDFVVTHFYRLMVHDLVLMSDVYWFYSQKRTEGKSLQEFSEILANLLEVESQNFDEINTAKLSIGEGEGVVPIVWDYFKDVIIKHLLDDASQFPFWASKLIVTSQPVKFGAPVVRAYWASLQNIYLTRGVKGMFEGCIPYMFASGYHNYRFLTKVTHAFISNVLSKRPLAAGSESIDEDLTSPLSSPKGQIKRKSLRDTDTPFPRDSLQVYNKNSLLEDAEVDSSGIGIPLPSPMVKHRTKSTADLSAFSCLELKPPTQQSAEDKPKLSMDAYIDNTSVSTNTAKPFHYNDLSSKNHTANNTNIINNGSMSSSAKVNPAGTYAMGTCGTAGAPKGYGSISTHGPTNELGYPTMRIAGAEHYSSVATIRPKKTHSPVTTDTMIMRQLQKACVAFMTHPLMVLSAAIVKNPVYQGKSSFVAFYQLVSTLGIRGLYTGFRSRFVVSLIPLSPVVLLGVADAIIYRRMDGQGSLDSTGGVLSVLKYITQEAVNSDGSGSVMSLFNYGLLTAVHVVPGFISFVAMRSLSWVILGSSLNRKHQISRRRDIVEAHVNLIDKKSPYE